MNENTPSICLRILALFLKIISRKVLIETTVNSWRKFQFQRIKKVINYSYITILANYKGKRFIFDHFLFS